MNSSTFRKRGEDRWKEVEGLLDQLDKNTARPEDTERLPALFRQICGDLSLAQHRMYSLPLCERINRLVIRAHHHLHAGTSDVAGRLWRGVMVGFPRQIREEWKLFWIVMFFFWVPFWGVFFSGYVDMRWIHAALSPEMIASLELGFGKEGSVQDLRDSFGSDFQMFGYYIKNNISIDFRVFAGGLLWGLGTLFFLFFNAVLIGAAAGYVTQEGDPSKFTDWISGHSTPEFLGLLFSAMAGLRLGLALLRPGRRQRSHALAVAGRKAVTLLYGAAGMTFLAALIEGFWSPRPLPAEVKYTAGALITLTLLSYLLFAGRREGTT